MTPGGLYLLHPMSENFPHIQAMFPYMQGGKVLVIKTQSTIIKGKKKELTVEIVEFLYEGKIYSESIDNFKKYAIYIGEVDYDHAGH